MDRDCYISETQLRWTPHAMNIFRVGSPEERIKDIYEAAIAAAVIRYFMLARIRQLRRLFERAVEKSL